MDLIFSSSPRICIDLNRFITNLVTYLQQNYIGRHTQNSAYSTKTAVHDKDKLFPSGKFLHVIIKDEAQFISCTPIKPENISHIMCDLRF